MQTPLLKLLWDEIFFCWYLYIKCNEKILQFYIIHNVCYKREKKLRYKVRKILQKEKYSRVQIMMFFFLPHKYTDMLTPFIFPSSVQQSPQDIYANHNPAITIKRGATVENFAVFVFFQLSFDIRISVFYTFKVVFQEFCL